MPCNCFTYPCVCANGDYYNDAGEFFPGGAKLPYNNVISDPYYTTCNPLYDKNCMDTTDYSIPVKGTTRPIVNTNYIDPNTGLSVNPNVNQWSFANLFNPQNTAAVNSATSANPVSGIMGAIQAHPVLALGGAALLLYFFMGSGGGTYEQITTKRKGFGS